MKNKYNGDRGRLKTNKKQKKALMHTKGKFSEVCGQLKAFKGYKRALMRT